MKDTGQRDEVTAGEPLAEMSLWDHVEALRVTLFKVIAAMVVVTVAMFLLMPRIFDTIILAPCSGDFPLYRWLEAIRDFVPGLEAYAGDGFHVDLINIQLASQFFVHISTSFWLGLVFSFPLVVYFLWQFIAPALYANERRGASKVFLSGMVLFYLGVAVGYYVAFPFSLRFFADYHVSELVPNQVSLDSYIDMFLSLVFTMGLVFEMPLVMVALSRIGLVNRSFFRRYRRHAVVALLVVAAFVTPSDPFSMIAVALPLYLLYELSAMLVRK